MALNPAISLGVNPPQFDDPIERRGRRLRLADLSRQDAAARRAEAEDAATRQAFAANVGPDGQLNTTGTLAQLYRVSPVAALKFEQSIATRRKAEGEAREQNLKVQAAQAQRLAQLAGMATDQQSYQAVIQTAIAEGLIPEQVAGQIPTQFDPQAMKQFQMQAMTAAQQHEAGLRETADRRAAAEHEARLPGMTADSTAKQVTAGQMSELGMTLREQEQLAQGAASAEETRRHNAASETQAATTAAEAHRHNRQTEAVARAGQLETGRHNAASEAMAKHRPMSADAAKTLAIVETMQPEIDALQQAFQKDYRGTTWGIVSGNDRNLRRLAESVAEKVGRIRSGGAVNKDEEQRFMAQIANWRDLPQGKVEDVIGALSRLRNEADLVRRRVSPDSAAGGPAGAPTVPVMPTGIRMRAPDGSERVVSADLASYYESKGAKRIQ